MFSRTTKTIQQKLQFNLQNSLDLLPYMKFPFLNHSVLSWPLKSFLPEKCKPLIKSISSQKITSTLQYFCKYNKLQVPLLVYSLMCKCGSAVHNQVNKTLR